MAWHMAVHHFCLVAVADVTTVPKILSSPKTQALRSQPNPSPHPVTLRPSNRMRRLREGRGRSYPNEETGKPKGGGEERDRNRGPTPSREGRGSGEVWGQRSAGVHRGWGREVQGVVTET